MTSLAHDERLESFFRGGVWTLCAAVVVFLLAFLPNGLAWSFLSVYVAAILGILGLAMFLARALAKRLRPIRPNAATRQLLFAGIVGLVAFPILLIGSEQVWGPWSKPRMFVETVAWLCVPSGLAFLVMGLFLMARESDRPLS